MHACIAIPAVFSKKELAGQFFYGTVALFTEHLS